MNDKLEDNFWGHDFCSTEGFTNVEKWLKDGSNMTKDVIEHLKQRSKIEEDYSKALAKLAKISYSSTVVGTLNNAWDCLKSETEKIASEHKALSSHLLEQASHLTAFMENQKCSRKQQKDKVEKCAKRKKEFFDKVLEQRKLFESKCRELDDFSSKITVRKQGNNMDKVLLQLQLKEGKLMSEKEKADESYKKLIKTLNEARVMWEHEMTKYLRLAQDLETKRMSRLQDDMWVITNLISQTCVDDDQHCENIRFSIEKCNIHADICLFIEQKKTGKEKPAQFHYIPYASQN